MKPGDDVIYDGGPDQISFPGRIKEIDENKALVEITEAQRWGVIDMPEGQVIACLPSRLKLQEGA